MIQESFLKNWDQIEAFCKEQGINEGDNPLIYVIKIYKYKISLRKFIHKLHVFITNKNVRKKSSDCLFNWPKIGVQLGPPPPLILSKSSNQNYNKAIYPKTNINMKISFYLFVRSEPKSEHAINEKTSRN